MKTLFHKFRALVRRSALDREMDAELRFHIEEQTRTNLAAGMSPDEAALAARKQFGWRERIRDEARETRGVRWLEDLAHDVRYAMRQLRRNPGFTAVVVLTLGLGIGACTGVFSVLDQLLLHPIGHDPHPENELQLFETQLPRTSESRVSPANFLDWAARAKSFSSIRAGAGADLTLTGEGEPLRLVGGRATHQFIDVHGWPLALGRGFSPEEDKPGNDRVIIISHRLWQGALGGAPDAIGRTLQINGESRTIVGIINEEVGRYMRSDAFVPMAFSEEERTQRGTRTLNVWARLKPGVTLEQARAEMNLLSAQLAQEFPATNQGWGASAITVVQKQGGAGLREALWTLLAAVGCVLLIACANVANLLLARATTRQREMAVRAALGGGRARLVRQLLTESMLLAMLGGAAGIALAHAGLAALHRYAAPGMERLGYVQLDTRMLVVALAMTVATGLVFGLAPAWLAARVDLNDALKRGVRGSTGNGTRTRLRSALVVLEVSLAVVLLACSGAMIRRLVDRAHSDPGFVSENATVLQVSLPRHKYAGSAQRTAFADEVLARLHGVPGVQAAGATTSLPITQTGIRFERDDSPPRPRSEWPMASTHAVTPDYFSAMGIRIVRGRAITARDNADAPRVVVINETLAKQFYADGDPVGRRLVLATNSPDVPREIVGIAADVTQFGADTTITPQIYEPFAQNPGTSISFVVRSRGEPGAILSSLKPQIHAVDRDQPVLSLRPLQEVLDDRVAGQRFAMHLLAVFSFVALVIAAVGIYGVTAYNVSQRTAEIGTRLALGAQPRDIFRLVLGQGGRLVVLGLLLGLGLACAAARLINSMLYRADALEPFTLMTISVTLVLVAFVACWLPARRAARVDPMVALRAE